MPSKLRTNAVIVFGLALLFAFFFDVTKHNLSFSSINPFAEDPYDAIGTFALQTTLFLGVLSFVRAFRPYNKAQPSGDQKMLLARTQIAIVLAVAVALAGDIVAMLRHRSLWFASPTGNIFGLLIIGSLAIVSVTGVFVVYSAKEALRFISPGSWRRPVLVSLLFFAVLCFYPENLRESVPGALITVVVGAFLLFMSTLAWGNFFSSNADLQSKTTAPRWLWGVIILIGIVLGFTIVVRELSEGGQIIDFANSAFIILIYMGLEVAGVVIGYAFLGKFLGIFQNQNRPAK